MKLPVFTNALQAAEQADHFRLSESWQIFNHTLRRRYRVDCFACPGGDALDWLAWLTKQPLAALLMDEVTPQDSECQLWLASPYHAQLARDAFYVTPSTHFPWHQQDAEKLIDLLNPLLSDEGMRLEHRHEQLFLYSQQQLDVQTPSFSYIQSHSLPNRTLRGADGMRLMRIMSEIQSYLYQYPMQHRQQHGWPAVSGLWFWAACPLPLATVTEPLLINGDHPALSSSTSASLQLFDHMPPPEKLPAVFILASNEGKVALRFQRCYSPLHWLRHRWLSNDSWHCANASSAQNLRQWVLHHA